MKMSEDIEIKNQSNSGDVALVEGGDGDSGEIKNDGESKEGSGAEVVKENVRVDKSGGKDNIIYVGGNRRAGPSQPVGDDPVKPRPGLCQCEA